jgi:DNA invertase Pin-like site-specific DNA recombinase
MALISAEELHLARRPPGDDVPEIVRLRRSGLTPKEIAASLATSESTVYRRLRPFGMQRRGGRKTVPIDPAEIERMYRSGLTIEAVARELGISDSVVYRRLKARGVPTRRPGESILAKSAPTRREALRLHAEGRDSREIAAELGIPLSTLYVWIRRETRRQCTGAEEARDRPPGRGEGEHSAATMEGDAGC